jgi:hypothetical protein
LTALAIRPPTSVAKSCTKRSEESRPVELLSVLNTIQKEEVMGLRISKAKPF